MDDLRVGPADGPHAQPVLAPGPSKVYEEPKKLVAHGLAKASAGTVGRRPRTVYSITAKGRRALAAWLAEPADGPQLEFEQLIKAFFADAGTTEDLLRTLDDVRAWAHERTVVNIEVGRAYLDETAPFLQRAALNTIVARFLDDFLESIDTWADWATTMAESWPERPSYAETDRDALEAIVRNAERRAERWLAAPRHRAREPPASAGVPHRAGQPRRPTARSSSSPRSGTGGEAGAVRAAARSTIPGWVSTSPLRPRAWAMSSVARNRSGSLPATCPPPGRAVRAGPRRGREVGSVVPPERRASRRDGAGPRRSCRARRGRCRGR